MVSHGREKQDNPNKTPTSQRRKNKGSNKKGGKNKNNDDDDDDLVDYRDMMELPEDFSITGGSSVYSGHSGDNGLDDANSNSNYGDNGGDDEYYDDEYGENDAPTAASVRQAKLVDALSLASTSLPSEKRSAKREGTYRVLFKAITQYAAGSLGRETLESRWDSVSEACLGSIRSKGGGGSGGSYTNSTPAEQYVACRVLEASSIILGEDRDDIVALLNEPLKKVVNATGRATQVRVAALRCLSMVHFICGTNYFEDGNDSFALMDLCENVCGEKYRGEKVSPLLRSTALDCWSLLGSNVGDALIAGDEEEEELNYDEPGEGGGNNDYDDEIEEGSSLGRGLKLLPLLAECLESSDANLRSSAGECVTFIHECRLNLGIDEDADNATERRFRRGSWDGSEWEVLMDEVKQRIAELSVESSRNMSKKSKKEQRATFRDYMNTIVDDEPPEEIVNFRGGRLKLNSWKEIVQLNFVRHCLQGGFQIQIMTNETLHDVFGADGQILSDAGGATMSQLEKRLTLSKTSEASKAADKKRTKQRRVRNNVKNHFLTADGEDI